MDSRSVAFLEVMLGLGAVGLLAFLILLVTRAAQRSPAADGRAATTSPAWWGFLLAFLLTLVIAVLLAIEFAPFGGTEVAEAPAATEAGEGTEPTTAGEQAVVAPDAAGAEAPPTETGEVNAATSAEEAAVAETGDEAAPAGTGADSVTPPAEPDGAAVAEEVEIVPPQEPADWRQGARGQAFYIVMVVVGGLALLGFLIVLFARILPLQAAFAASHAAPATAATSGTEKPEPAAVETPSGARLIGLLLLAIMYLLLNWIYLGRADQHALLTNLVYPASLGVALVLLFDKATRVWSVKTGSETVREWFLCNGFAFLLLLGFLNLRGAPADETYASMFWDFLAIVLFFVAFWIVDRKGTAFRFLIGYGYLILLPILLIIWRATQGLVAPEDISWWSTVWPVFFLSIIFFVLEVILLIASRDTPRHGIGALKDAVFVVLYAITLIAAIPAEVAA